MSSHHNQAFTAQKALDRTLAVWFWEYALETDLSTEVRVRALAIPLVDVNDSEDVRAKVVEPLLDTMKQAMEQKE